MRRVLQIISWLALVVLTAAPALFLFDGLSLDGAKWGMLGATVVWFVVTPLWMGREDQKTAGA
jgi:hypothetical protein